MGNHALGRNGVVLETTSALVKEYETATGNKDWKPTVNTSAPEEAIDQSDDPIPTAQPFAVSQPGTPEEPTMSDAPPVNHTDSDDDVDPPGSIRPVRRSARLAG